jgi:hypothetical protein
MKNRLNEKLSQLLLELDRAIAQAVQNPLLIADGPLQSIESTCAALVILDEAPPHGDLEPDFEERRKLIWQVRARSGRLQLLLDAAAQFYASCFSLDQPEDLAYGVHGEWSARGNSSHLALDC